MEAKKILARPYARILTPEADGRFTAEILEFPGCVTFGDSAEQALANLEDVAADWIAAAVEQGQDIPAPMDSTGYSGKLVLRMSSGLHKRAALCAQREGVSLNQFIVTCLAEAVGERARPAARPLQWIEYHRIQTALSTQDLGPVNAVHPLDWIAKSSDNHIVQFSSQRENKNA